MLGAEPKGFFRYRFLEGTFGGLIPPEEQEQARRTFSGAALVILCLFGLLFLRLWFLQLVQGEDLRQRSEHNRIRQLDLPPWRGMILDRHGQVLVRSDLTWEALARVETYQSELPGVMVQIQPKRQYRHKGQAAHVLGYLGEVTDVQLKSGKFSGYKMGDYLGRCGVELAWEKYLRGQRGYRRIEVDAYGRELGQLDRIFPTPGANVFLTLDDKLQQEAEACLEGKMGAIVALDPRSGKILAMASSPTYSQEAFERGLSVSEWQKLSTAKDHPLENRPLKGQYPPGSTFKIVMAVAGLEEKVITPSPVFYCNGTMPFGK